jgi:hypothetical protein
MLSLFLVSIDCITFLENALYKNERTKQNNTIQNKTRSSSHIRRAAAAVALDDSIRFDSIRFIFVYVFFNTHTIIIFVSDLYPNIICQSCPIRIPTTTVV